MTNIPINVMVVTIFAEVLWEIEQSGEPVSRQTLVPSVRAHTLSVARSAKYEDPTRLSNDIEITLTEVLRLLDDRLKDWPPHQ